MSNQIQPTNNPRRGIDPRVIAAIIAGLYTVSPIDVVPDIIPVLGQMDDAGVIALAVIAMLVMTLAGVNSRNNQ
ncbi:MAG: YkvA family protein [Caldilineaceae bacterium]